jgi:hypothetical protein
LGSDVALGSGGVVASAGATVTVPGVAAPGVAAAGVPAAGVAPAGGASRPLALTIAVSFLPCSRYSLWLNSSVSFCR